jgi:ribokinase
MKKALVSVVGSYVQDLAFKTAILPAPGETRIGSFMQGPGGKGFNQAIACHRQGIQTEFVGSVGRDVFSDALQNFAAIENMELRLQFHERESSGAASIVVEDSTAQNQIVVALGANAFLDPDFVEKQIDPEAKVILAQLEVNLKATKKALEVGRRQKSINILNPAPINPEVDLEILRLANILTPNETEFSFLQQHFFNNKLTAEYWKNSPEELHRLCRLFEVETVVITLGRDGAFVSTRDGFFQQPVFSVDAVDSTGAGDAFSGGLAAGIVKFKSDLQVAVTFASAVAALSTTKAGTAPAMPTEESVKALFAP